MESCFCSHAVPRPQLIGKCTPYVIVSMTRNNDVGELVEQHDSLIGVASPCGNRNVELLGRGRARRQWIAVTPDAPVDGDPG